MSGIIQEDAAGWKAFPQLLELSRAVKGIITVWGRAKLSRANRNLAYATSQEVLNGHDSAQ